LRATLTVGCAAITRVDPTSQVERLTGNFLLTRSERLLASRYLSRIRLWCFGLHGIEQLRSSSQFVLRQTKVACIERAG
jgi:hypothetical protein